MPTDAQRLRYLTAIVGAMSKGSPGGTPCSNNDYTLWTSAIAADRAAAARACTGCTVLQSCGQQAVARRETSGVWGAKDYGP